MVLGVFIVAVVFRLVKLGNLPLNNYEAEFALQALAVARRRTTEFGQHAAYVGLTGISFFLFSASNFLARFWPAVLGSLVVFAPFLFRKQLGQTPALIAAVALAISPDLVGLSRIVGSPILALVFTVLTLGFWVNRQPIFAGVSLAFALMGGTSFWSGVVILGVSVLVTWWITDLRLYIVEDVKSKPKGYWLRFGLSFGLTLTVIGTGFFMAPANMSGVFAGLFAFLTGFGARSLVPIFIIPLALIAYSTGALFFGLWGGVRGIVLKSNVDRFLVIWAGVSLLLSLVNPAAGAEELVWTVFPLWLLGGRVIAAAWEKPAKNKLVVGILASLIFALSAFVFLALRTLTLLTLTSQQQANYLIALGGAVVLTVAIVLLVNYGWSEKIARAGLLLGLGLVFVAGMVSISVNGSGIGPNTPYELWYPHEAVIDTPWLNITADRVLVWNMRRVEPVDMMVAGLDTPGLRWALRGYDPLTFIPFTPPQSQPGLLITPLGVQPEIAHGYQGQSLVWARTVPWREMSAEQVLKWLVNRDVPTLIEELIIWVRVDLMPGG